MPKKKMNRLWQIIYPIVVYYLLYHMIYSILNLVVSESVARLWLLGIASAITIPFIYLLYRKAPVVRVEKLFSKETARFDVLGIFLVIVLGIGLNLLISHTPLVQVSEGYARANATLYAGDYLAKIFSNCLCIPILEELLYRGILCGQLKLWYGSKAAVFVSAILFGVMHFNVVQFIYGCLMGIALGVLYTRTSKLWVCIAAHGLTNLVVVLLAGVI